MKRSIKGYENMSHAGSFRLTLTEVPRANLGMGSPLEILDVLREKKASHLPAHSIYSPKKKYKSDDIIEDDEEDESTQAGPSSSKKK